MSVGRKFVTTVAFDPTTRVAYVERLDLGEKFSYEAGVVSTVQVRRDDRGGFDDGAQQYTLLNRYIVTNFWIVGQGPNIATYTVANFLSDALTAITTAGYTLPTP